MVCKKCGKSFNDNNTTCPFCGVGQENQINIKKLENEFKKLKIEEDSSSFCGDKSDDFEIFDIDDIIEDLEELKIKDNKKDDTPVPRVEPVSDEEIIELISEIKENKDLFVKDKSQYQYTQNNEELNSNSNITISDLYSKQKLYNPEAPKIEKKEKIELPHILDLPKDNNAFFDIDYEKNKKSYKKEIVICLIALIFMIIIGGLFIYKIRFSSKVILFKHLDSIYNRLENSINNHINNFDVLLDKDKILVNSVSTITTTENNIQSKEIINIKYSEDKTCKTQYYEYSNFNNIKTDFKKLFIKNNKLYMTEKDNNDEYHVMDANFYSVLNNNSTYLVKILLDSMKENITNGNFKTKTIEQSYNKKNYKLREYSLNIDEKLYSDIYSSFLKNIKEDEKAINLILENHHYSSVELMNEIDNKINELKTKNSDKIISAIKVYMNSNNEFIKYSINYGDYDLTIWNIEDKIDVVVNKGKNELISIEIKNIDESTNKHQISLYYNNYVLLGNYYEEESKVIFNYQKNYKESQKKEIVNLVLTKGEKNSDKYSNNIKLAYQKQENNNVISKNYDITNVIEADKSEYIPSPSKTKILEVNLIDNLKQKFYVFIK